MLVCLFVRACHSVLRGMPSFTGKGFLASICVPDVTLNLLCLARAGGYLLSLQKWFFSFTTQASRYFFFVRGECPPRRLRYFFSQKTAWRYKFALSTSEFKCFLPKMLMCPFHLSTGNLLIRPTNMIILPLRGLETYRVPFEFSVFSSL